MKRTLKEQYDNVFNENGEIRLCGRYSCMELIVRLNNIKESFSKLNFGDVETGMMNPEDIKKAMDILK